MGWSESATAAIEELLVFARQNGLIEEEDVAYTRNLLLDALKMDAPAQGSPSEAVGETATRQLNSLCDLAQQVKLIGDLQADRDLFSARLMGLLTPHPTEVRRCFAEAYQQSPRKATEYFYHLCRSCDYIKVDAIAQNIRYFADTDVGNLEITINLSKPEKDPREIARLKNAPSVGYPLCMLCVENPGYAGRHNFPARQNHRMIPLTLAGDRWYFQYSPYAYYSEHCIVLNSQHIPMKVSRGTFDRLFSFVSQFPHYFLGSNADLPIVGGSILNHDHFQGGCYTFPMDHAKPKLILNSPAEGVDAWIVDWPMSAIRLAGRDPKALTDLAVRILDAWREWSDPSLEILSHSGDTPHNTITPILRKEEDRWLLTLVLRNNRTTEQHPLGLFHPHAERHHIKKENIGLIEVMGLFILPGRLKTELALLSGYLTGEKPCREPSESDPCRIHFSWIRQLCEKYGTKNTQEDAESILRKETAQVCAEVLKDAGVYKQTPEGINGMLRFLSTVGFEARGGETA